MTAGIVAAGHPATAAAGAAMLAAGGNAADAAVAASFASFVAEPTLVSPGGGGYALLYQHASQEARLYDFFCSFPGLEGAAPENLDFFPVQIDYGPARQVFHIGRGSVAVPGVIAGLCRLQADAGRLALADVLAPAIRLAREGVALGDFGSYVGHLLYPIFSNEAAVARLFGAPERFLAPDHVYRNPELAATFTDLGRAGPDLFYRGEIAGVILEDQRRRGGLLTAEDLASYQVIVREPLRRAYRGYEFLTNPPPSRGGALIAFALALLEAFDLAALPFGGARHLRLLAEVMRQTNGARPLLESSGDACALLAADHVQEHSQALRQRLGNRHGADFRSLEEGGSAARSQNTTHISVLDEHGALVSLTTTAGESPGFVLPGTGLILNNILGEADLHPQGFHRGRPGQRIGSMMAPSIVLRAGEPVLAVGSGGANRIRTAILQVLVNLLDFGLDLRAAVEAPRIHFEDGVLQIEAGARPHSIGWLRRQGYDLVRWSQVHMFFGGAHAVGRNGDDPFQGAGDPRRSGAVVRVP